MIALRVPHNILKIDHLASLPFFLNNFLLTNFQVFPDLENFEKIFVFFKKGSDYGRYNDRNVSEV